ncbi:hypothetical protein PSP6_540052 [Paraburkholderia tropica]|uniref:DUF3717 domain-containing protein n=1 Tax=Paraburkholderia tropica TaxID=92647 RepID=UPI001CAF57A2|nr:DUF3717 domain-containing protein [Paraburkholderia tropica]CAG9230098.1 hypothetical protein PSP6_540052 [Paraburkholderia tropica]
MDAVACSISDLEVAINFWRERSPSQGDELALCQEASALATLYARMIVTHAESFFINDQSYIVRAAIAVAQKELAS